MKTFSTLVLSILVTLSGIAQNSPINFETGGHGASWTWTVFENNTNPALDIVANPDASGVNTSSTVAKFTALQTGQPWAGCESQHGADIGTFTLTASTSTIKIMVWKNVISDVGIKLVDANSASLGEIKIANTVTGEWEEIEFDFSSREGIPYDQIVVFPDFDLGGRSSDNICYFDNITFGNISAPEAPEVAAPDPTHLEENVISLFSDAYTDVAVDTFLTAWSSGSMSKIEIDNNPTILYQSLNFVGIETTGPNTIDIDSMDSLHLNVWSPDITEFKLKIVDFGQDGQFDGGDDSEHELVFSNPTQEEWIDYNLPISSFTDLASKGHIAQIILSAVPVGGANLYLDNLYFSKVAIDTSTTDTTTNDTSSLGLIDLGGEKALVQLYPNPAKDVIKISANHKINQLILYDLLGNIMLKQYPESTTVSADLKELPQGTYIVKTNSDLGEVTKRLIVR